MNDEEMITTKLVRPSNISRGMCLYVGLLALQVASLALAAPLTDERAPAPAETTERPVTDGDVERYLPRLRAEASALETGVEEALESTAEIESAAAEQEKLYEDIVSGKTDVLAWIRAHTEYALTPAGAVYSAECSRVVTGEGGGMTAVFTFGKESPHRDLLRRASAGDTAALNEFYRRRGREETGGRSAAVQAAHDLMVKMVSFYRDLGFADVESIWFQSVLLTTLEPPDRSVTVYVWEVNPYAGVIHLNALPVCAALPTGPMVEIEFAGEPEEEAASAVESEEAPSVASAAWEPDPEYERVKEALLVAWMDAADPSAIEVEIPPDAPPEVKAEIAALRAEFAVRRANVAVYLRHNAELAPILEALMTATGQ